MAENNRKRRSSSQEEEPQDVSLLVECLSTVFEEPNLKTAVAITEFNNQHKHIGTEWFLNKPVAVKYKLVTIHESLGLIRFSSSNIGSADPVDCFHINCFETLSMDSPQKHYALCTVTGEGNCFYHSICGYFMIMMPKLDHFHFYNQLRNETATTLLKHIDDGKSSLTNGLTMLEFFENFLAAETVTVLVKKGKKIRREVQRYGVKGETFREKFVNFVEENRINCTFSNNMMSIGVALLTGRSLHIYSCYDGKVSLRACFNVGEAMNTEPIILIQDPGEGEGGQHFLSVVPLEKEMEDYVAPSEPPKNTRTHNNCGECLPPRRISAIRQSQRLRAENSPAALACAVAQRRLVVEDDRPRAEVSTRSMAKERLRVELEGRTMVAEECRQLTHKAGRQRVANKCADACAVAERRRVAHETERQRMADLERADACAVAERRRVVQQEAEEAHVAERQRVADLERADACAVAERRRVVQQEAEEAHEAERQRVADQERADACAVAERRRVVQQEEAEALAHFEALVYCEERFHRDRAEAVARSAVVAQESFRVEELYHRDRAEAAARSAVVAQESFRVEELYHRDRAEAAARSVHHFQVTGMYFNL